MDFLKEFFEFIRYRKKYWLLPILLTSTQLVIYMQLLNKLLEIQKDL